MGLFGDQARLFRQLGDYHVYATANSGVTCVFWLIREGIGSFQSPGKNGVLGRLMEVIF